MMILHLRAMEVRSESSLGPDREGAAYIVSRSSSDRSSPRLYHVGEQWVSWLRHWW